MNDFFRSVATTLSSPFSGNPAPEAENNANSHLTEKPKNIEVATETDRTALNTPTTQSDFVTQHSFSPSPGLDLKNVTSLETEHKESFREPLERAFPGSATSEELSSSAQLPEGFPLFTKEELAQLEARNSVDKVHPQSKEGIRSVSSYRLITNMSAETIMAHICNPKNIAPFLPNCSALSVTQSETDKNGLIVSFIAKCTFHAPPPHTEKTKEVELAFKLTPTAQGYSFTLTPITPSPYAKDCKIELTVASHQGKVFISHTVSLRLELPMIYFWVPNSMIDNNMLQINQKSLYDILIRVIKNKTNKSIIDPLIVDNLLKLRIDAQDTLAA